MHFKLIPIPEPLKEYVACIRSANYRSDAKAEIKVCLNGMPGLVFQHHDGYSPIESIVTQSGVRSNVPRLYLYGQITEPGTMIHKRMPFSTIQIVLKPHALSALMGIDASLLTNDVVELSEFSKENLETQLLHASSEQEQIDLLINFLSKKFQAIKTRNTLITASLQLIHRHSTDIGVKDLLDTLHVSERHFERQFMQNIGVTPQFYIRIKRFNAAIRLMQRRPETNLGDIGHTLNYYDQSHFIRDVKAFSGITPKKLSRIVDDFKTEQPVLAYL